jgi:hypothetical protein
MGTFLSLLLPLGRVGNSRYTKFSCAGARAAPAAARPRQASVSSRPCCCSRSSTLAARAKKAICARSRRFHQPPLPSSLPRPRPCLTTTKLYRGRHTLHCSARSPPYILATAVRSGLRGAAKEAYRLGQQRRDGDPKASRPRTQLSSAFCPIIRQHNPATQPTAAPLPMTLSR